jgi:hypothetical protein
VGPVRDGWEGNKEENGRTTRIHFGIENVKYDEQGNCLVDASEREGRGSYRGYG